MTRPTPDPGGPERPRRILVVDDEESILFALRDYLTMQGHRVDAAATAADAEALLERQGYDLLIVDLRLDPARPTGGLDLVRVAKRVIPETRVVMLTAHGSPEVEREACESGVDAFLTKPRPLGEIARLVSTLTSVSPVRRLPTLP